MAVLDLLPLVIFSLLFDLERRRGFRVAHWYGLVVRRRTADLVPVNKIEITFRNQSHHLQSVTTLLKSCVCV